MKIKFIFICHFVLLNAGAQNSIMVRFLPKMVNEDLYLQKEYLLDKDTIDISQLKFYISDMSFYDLDTLVYVLKKKYHLFDLSQPTTVCLAEKLVCPIKYNHVKFNIGIDSLTNVSGAMDGDLDPTNGMYWTWQSGYINFKMEGISSICPARPKKFQWHIGGYLTPYNTLKEVSLSTQDATNVVNIEVHIDKLLRTFDLSQTHQIMSPNARAVEIADQLPTIFKIAQDEK